MEKLIRQGFMKKLPRLITCMLLFSILLPLLSVEAALPSPNPQTITLLTSYSSGVSGVNIGQGYQRVLSNYPQLALNITLNAGAGNVISQIEFMQYGSPISTSIVANNAQNQTISTTFTGEVKNVVSGDGNTTAEGYYAWYRYSNAPYWFADIPPTGQNSSNPSSCGAALTCFGDPGQYDVFNSTNFWKFPNASSNQLTMSGARTIGYVLEDSTSTAIPIDYVSNNPSYFSASSTVDTGKLNIPGGFGDSGTASSVNGSPTTTMSDKDHFTVKFSKDFTSVANSRGDFAAAGAAWMDWFFAFKTTMKSKTFIYPDSIRVTYALAGGTPTPTPTATPVGQTPTPTPVATATPTPTPTPTPIPCGAPPTVTMIAPNKAKQGEDFYISGFGSKQANGGTNLSYQWYYYEIKSDGGYGSLETGPSTINGTINILVQGNYNIVLGITDLNDTICSAQAVRSITINAPGPDADVSVRGTLKIKRPMLLDGSSSSSPSAYPISDASRQFSITYPSGVTASDCITLDSLSGTKTARIMCKKPGNYKVSYSVTNSLGLSSTKTTPFTIVDDLRPVGNLQGPSLTYRDPNKNNKVSIPLTFTFTSPDNDTIATTVIGAIFDANNDGYFVEDINNTLPTAYNLINGTASVTANTVGHVRNIISGCETFDAGDFVSYLTASDYLCSAGYLDVTVDNQAPTMNVGASKKYKSDIFVNIGAVPTADQTYLLNNIQNLKAALGALQVDANIVSSMWDMNVEGDFLKDSNTKLNNDMTWRSRLDQKYFVGFTNQLTQTGSGSSLEILNLKNIPAYSTALTGTIETAMFSPKAGRTAYITYYKNTNPSYSDEYDTKLFVATNGSGNDVLTMAHHVHNAAYPYSSYGRLDFDTMGNYYVVKTQSLNDPDEAFRHDYSIMSASAGTFNLPSSYKHNQIISKPSYVNGLWTVWSASGIFYLDTWQQEENYFRKASNGWYPTTSPDYYGGGSNVDVYTEGYQVGANSYWFGYTGSTSSLYLSLHYNGGGAIPFSNFSSNIYNHVISGNSVTIIVTDKTDATFHKLTFTNGVLVTDDKLTGFIVNNNYTARFNFNSNKAYSFGQTTVDGKTHYQVTEYDMATKGVNWTKITDDGITLFDVGADNDGVTPIYLFKKDLSPLLFISKDNDPSAGSTNVIQYVSTADQTVSYNSNRAYSWIAKDSVNTTKIDLATNNYTTSIDPLGGTDWKIKNVDPTGKYTYKSFPAVDGTILFGAYTFKNNSVVTFGYNSKNGKLFYAVDSDKYIVKPLSGAAMTTQNGAGVYTGTGSVLTDNANLDHVYLNINNKSYQFDITNGTLTLISGVTLIPVGGIVGETRYTYGTDGGGAYTDDPTVQPQPKIGSFVVNQNLNGYDRFLFDGSNYFNNINFYGGLKFDQNSNSFARFGIEYASTGLTAVIQGVFYDSSSNSYLKKTQQIQTNGPSYSMLVNDSNSINLSNSSFIYQLKNYVNNIAQSVSIYKMNKNGTTLLYTIADPNASDSQKGIHSINAAQDEQGYTYILYSTWNNQYISGNWQFVYTSYLVTNRSGSFVSYTLNSGNFGNRYAVPYVHNGILVYYTGNQFFYMNTNAISSNPTAISMPQNSFPQDFTPSDLQWDSGNLYAAGVYGINQNNYVFFSSAAPGILFNYGPFDFYLDQYDIYLNYKNGGQLLKLNKKTLALQDANTNMGSNTFAMKARGKVMQYTYDYSLLKATLKVINGIDLGQNDPNFINTIGGQGIKQIFVGTKSILANDVNPLIQQNGGYLIDSAESTDAANSINRVATTIFDDLRNKNGSPNGNTYYLLGDTLNLKGLYADYESDPMKASSWNVVIDPAMFDNNQGMIATNGQDVATPPTLFDHVGKYTVKVKGQDDPTTGIAALSPFSKWSNPTPLTFYVHRIPIAHFDYTLRDNPSNPTQALFSYVEDSYDLDHSDTLAATTKGIVTKTWRWKLASDLIWQDGLPPSVLIKNSDYVLSLIVTDLEGAQSDPFTVSFNTGNLTPNMLPTAVIIDPTGTTAANPTVYSTLTPNYKWTYADADGDPQERYTFNVYDSSNNIVTTSNEVMSSSKFFQQPASLSENVVYSVQVKVHDGFGYGALSAKKYFKIITNLPPTGNLTFTTPIYQHDTPAFTVTQSDPNGDVLNTVVAISFNGGSYLNIAQWSSVPSGASRSFNYGPLAQGSYTLRLTIDDGKGGVFVKIYPFTALPLTLNSAVSHTTNWESNRLKWNIKFPTKQRASNVFWAGEAFVLSSNVTNTGTSLTKPISVSATLVETGDSVNLSSVDQIYFTGEMVNTDFIHSLKDGLYTMRFQIHWSNGMIQTTDVPLQIKGNLFDVLVVQLRN
jgi:hypothetical protein